ncbi:hypothetical protein QQZ08_001323 [Neonectria magnoliae]|uniref:Uncharacterized protein n=1 Tax=Neonectria magnoliae TaxID=2732573 RepID=A0ABR1IGP7_9HYPO
MAVFPQSIPKDDNLIGTVRPLFTPPSLVPAKTAKKASKKTAPVETSRPVSTLSSPEAAKSLPLGNKTSNNGITASLPPLSAPDSTGATKRASSKKTPKNNEASKVLQPLPVSSPLKSAKPSATSKPARKTKTWCQHDPISFDGPIQAPALADYVHRRKSLESSTPSQSSLPLKQLLGKKNPMDDKELLSGLGISAACKLVSLLGQDPRTGGGQQRDCFTSSPFVKSLLNGPPKTAPGVVTKGGANEKAKAKAKTVNEKSTSAVAKKKTPTDTEKTSTDAKTITPSDANKKTPADAKTKALKESTAKSVPPANTNKEPTPAASGSSSASKAKPPQPSSQRQNDPPPKATGSTKPQGTSGHEKPSIPQREIQKPSSQAQGGHGHGSSSAAQTIANSISNSGCENSGEESSGNSTPSTLSSEVNLAISPVANSSSSSDWEDSEEEAGSPSPQNSEWPPNDQYLPVGLGIGQDYEDPGFSPVDYNHPEFSQFDASGYNEFAHASGGSHQAPEGYGYQSPRSHSPFDTNHGYDTDSRPRVGGEPEHQYNDAPPIGYGQQSSGGFSHYDVNNESDHVAVNNAAYYTDQSHGNYTQFDSSAQNGYNTNRGVDYSYQGFDGFSHFDVSGGQYHAQVNEESEDGTSDSSSSQDSGSEDNDPNEHYGNGSYSHDWQSNNGNMHMAYQADVTSPSGPYGAEAATSSESDSDEEGEEGDVSDDDEEEEVQHHQHQQYHQYQQYQNNGWEEGEDEGDETDETDEGDDTDEGDGTDEGDEGDGTDEGDDTDDSD